MSIKLLDNAIINRIAAGEIIVRPANVVKELVENSIDSNASVIKIEIYHGGKTLIRVTDNGCGMSKDDLLLCITRHATSKLEDGNLINIKKLGFRGEGLASIAAISRLSISSAKIDLDECWELISVPDCDLEIRPCSVVHGTKIAVNDLFFSTPNRLKFLSSEKTEVYYIHEILNKLALSYPNVRFIFLNDAKKIFDYVAIESSWKEQVLHRVAMVNGLKKLTQSHAAIEYSSGYLNLDGLVSCDEVCHSNSKLIYTFVNKRPIKDLSIYQAIRNVYQNFIPNNKYPIILLYISIPPEKVDVNVHPTKSEIRFQDPVFISSTIASSIYAALSGGKDSSVLSSLKDKSNASVSQRNDVVSQDQGLDKDKESSKNFQNDEVQDVLMNNKNITSVESSESEKPILKSTMVGQDSDNDFLKDNQVSKVKSVPKCQNILRENGDLCDDKSVSKMNSNHHDSKLNLTDFNGSFNESSTKGDEFLHKTLDKESVFDCEKSNQKQISSTNVPKVNKNLASFVNSGYKNSKNIISDKTIHNRRLKDHEFSQDLSFEKGDFTKKESKTYFFQRIADALSVDFICNLYDKYLIVKSNGESDNFSFLNLDVFKEMILHDLLLKKLVCSEYLHVPVIVDLSDSEVKCIMSRSDFFKDIGFLVEKFGLNSLSINSIPSILLKKDGVFLRSFILDLMNFADAEDEGIKLCAKLFAEHTDDYLSILNSLIESNHAFNFNYMSSSGVKAFAKIKLSEIELFFRDA